MLNATFHNFRCAKDCSVGCSSCFESTFWRCYHRKLKVLCGVRFESCKVRVLLSLSDFKYCKLISIWNCTKFLQRREESNPLWIRKIH